MEYLSEKGGKTKLYFIITINILILGFMIISFVLDEKYPQAILFGLVFISLFLVGKYVTKIQKIQTIFFDEEKYYINSKSTWHLKSDLIKIENNFLSASYIEFKGGIRYYFLGKPPWKKLGFFTPSDLID
ncbi:hypothetical protein E7Z59_07055 [Robertkochia marina]|uniref:Uncharacterized protein n=1 Tax=Robertkochia marina TaxID=1227945 RepID=A0A4S3M0C8_9FLAO|nr:hypothetical protein [Robertkochia marina]THD67413.1 hypothetical protein E7Z59_07055 [Robertkochia marina]TRZ40800.1 hypothetical protein D3A96_15290 [Robertkochia marina]